MHTGNLLRTCGEKVVCTLPAHGRPGNADGLRCGHHDHIMTLGEQCHSSLITDTAAVSFETSNTKQPVECLTCRRGAALRPFMSGSQTCMLAMCPALTLHCSLTGPP